MQTDLKIPFYKRTWFLVLVALFGGGFIASRIPSDVVEKYVPLYLCSLALLVAVAIFFGRYWAQKAFDKSYGVRSRLRGKHVHGLPIQINQRVDVMLVEGSLFFKSKGLMAEVKLDQLQLATTMKYNQWAMMQTDASISGHVGSIFDDSYEGFSGRISGVGTAMKPGNYLVINYMSSMTGLSTIVVNGRFFSTNSFAQLLNREASVGVVQL